MGNSTFLGLFFTLFSSNLNAQKLNKKTSIDIFDSLKVVKFVNESTVLSQIKYVERNIIFFGEPNGYSNLILKSISDKTNTKIFIPVINGNAISTKKQLERSLQEQLDLIKKNFCKDSHTGASVPDSNY